MIGEKINNRINEVLGVEGVELGGTEREEHGDFSTNIAMQIFCSKEEILRSTENDGGDEEAQDDSKNKVVVRKALDDKSDFQIISDLYNYKSLKQLAEYIVGLLINDQVLSNTVLWSGSINKNFVLVC